MFDAACFVLGVFRDRGTYLVVQERDGTWYLPAGKVEDAENLVAALVRETMEEAAQLVGVQGIVGVDHEWRVQPRPHARLRFVFAGYRGVMLPPKDRADEHSLRAEWMTREAIGALPLRHPEVLAWIDKVDAGAPLLPTGAYDWIGPPGPARRVVAVTGRA